MKRCCSTVSVFLIDKSSFRDIFDFRMTMFGVTRGKVEFGSIFGLKRTEEQVLGCRKVEPGDYNLAHGFVSMDVAVGPDDSVSVATDSIVSARGISDIKFGVDIFALPALQRTNESLSVTPKFGEAALTIGPDVDGITLSLERYANESVAPVAIGTLRIETALKLSKPKVNKKAVFGGGGIVSE